MAPVLAAVHTTVLSTVPESHQRVADKPSRGWQDDRRRDSMDEDHGTPPRQGLSLRNMSGLWDGSLVVVVSKSVGTFQLYSKETDLLTQAPHFLGHRDIQDVPGPGLIRQSSENPGNPPGQSGDLDIPGLFPDLGPVPHFHAEDVIDPCLLCCQPGGKNLWNIKFILPNTSCFRMPYILLIVPFSNVDT